MSVDQRCGAEDVLRSQRVVCWLNGLRTEMGNPIVNSYSDDAKYTGEYCPGEAIRRLRCSLWPLWLHGLWCGFEFPIISGVDDLSWNVVP